MTVAAPAQVVTANPATGEPLASYPAHDAAAVEAILAAGARSARTWALTPLADRLALLVRVGELLTQRRDAYAALITAEMGKPLSEALAEIDKCALNCAVVAQQAPLWLADRPLESGSGRAFLAYEPIGVVLAVMPWNYPFWQVIRFACAALASGNAALLKHSPDTTGSALAMEQLFLDAGAPAGLFGVLVLTADQVGDVVPGIISDPRIAAVTLTGSERAGSAVAAAAGAALKKTVLELGGSDPFVVLPGADLVAAAAAAAKSRFGNNGQSCVAAKRFIVVDEVADEFVSHFVNAVQALVVGDPMTPGTTVGPMARADLRTALLAQIAATVAQGAEVVTGGQAIDAPGWFVEPTVLDRVEPRMTAFDQETFGPVAAVIRARDTAHAIALANDTEFGLAASVWGRSVEALAAGRRIASGALFVNTMVASDPRIPFGGIKRSGYGRELSADGLREFTNVRTVVVA